MAGEEPPPYDIDSPLLMNEPSHLSSLLHRAYHTGGWIEVSPRELFHGLKAAEAFAHPIPGAHSVWEIALHLTTWHDAVRRRIEGDFTEVTDKEDWPQPAEPTESKWQAALDELDRSLEALVKTVSEMKSDKLNQTVPSRTFTFHTMLSGSVHHDFYHAGQVMMLKKAVQNF